MSRRTPDLDLPDLTGRRAVLTGGSDGIGLEIASRLAATSPDAVGGRLYGPGGLQHLGGAPAEQPLYRPLRDADDARRIWTASEELIGMPIDTFLTTTHDTARGTAHGTATP